jgi:hypothetical protein
LCHDKEWAPRERWGSARKKVWEALHVMVGDGAMRERLGFAYSLLLQLQPDRDLPEELRPRFRKLMRELEKRAEVTSYRPVRIVTKAPKAGKLGEEILAIYAELNDGI